MTNAFNINNRRDIHIREKKRTELKIIKEKNCNEKLLQIKKKIQYDIYIVYSSFTLFYGFLRDAIARIHCTCVHWRQETSLPDNFCNDKTTNVFVESTGLYTHIRSLSSSGEKYFPHTFFNSFRRAYILH